MSWLRRPKTTQERRANSDVEHKKLIRKKRSAKRLPNAYDDIIVDGYGKKHKSWKKLRKIKYKN